jgi:hypothetical protein
VQRKRAHEIARGELVVVQRVAGVAADLERAFGLDEIGMGAGRE